MIGIDFIDRRGMRCRRSNARVSCRRPQQRCRLGICSLCPHLQMWLPRLRRSACLQAWPAQHGLLAFRCLSALLGRIGNQLPTVITEGDCYRCCLCGARAPAGATSSGGQPAGCTERSGLLDLQLWQQRAGW